MIDLLKTFSWQELRHHPWRNGAAVVAVMLGVALAFSVSLINNSALSEFAQAVRSVNGQADLELRAVGGDFDEAVFARVATDPRVALASPILETRVRLQAPGGAVESLRIVGVDALRIAPIAPDMLPRPVSDAGRLSWFEPDALFLNPAAAQALGVRSVSMPTVQVRGLRQAQALRVRGDVAAAGGPLAVMDIGAAQDLFGAVGRLTRIDLRLAPGQDPRALAAAWQADPQWPAGVRAAPPADTATSVSNLSRAYRVNLTVLALVALFTGAFLVFSVLALSVAKRAQQFALLGVLGLGARQRLRLVLAEAALLGTLGSALGIALGTALAMLALRWLGGDLGGGYFRGVAPVLQFNGWSAAAYGALGIAAAMAGAWLPARDAERLPPAQTLKGLGPLAQGPDHPWRALVLVLACAALLLVPPLWGMALGAYLAIAVLLVGGISALPSLIAIATRRLAPAVSAWALPMLAIERARRVRAGAAVAVSGVVAALSLAVALTVMVASFRTSVQDWLGVVLPADLYVRHAGGAGATAFFAPDTLQALQGLPGVAAVAGARTVPLTLASDRPAVPLLARPLAPRPERTLALVGPLQPVPADAIAVYVSEPMVALYGARVGQPFALLDAVFADTSARAADAPVPRFVVAGVWRDYGRQFGAIAIDRQDFERLTGDDRISELAVTLDSGADAGALQAALRAQLARLQPTAEMELASAGEIRATSLRIFDRSFAVTYWLQAVAIAIGLFGVAANFSAQVLARRKEFGLLAHLGVTPRQVLTLVALEGLAWTGIGALAGLLLGLGVSVILVHVVNPQSFHWTMDLMLPWRQLAGLCAATVLAGTCTAWLAARAAAGRDVVLAVKEDW
ncbi:MAG: ABC transporter permease [Rhodoferax sp.]|nr:ABC transporter permease [Rhodoferax sp.]